MNIYFFKKIYCMKIYYMVNLVRPITQILFFERRE
jgi:hypothetical protein